MNLNDYLLTDSQLQFYIENGYISLKSSRPAQLHQQILEKMETVFEKEGNPGNNMIPRIPEIQEVLTDPVIDGALTSIVGPNYYAHPHRHPHFNAPGSSGQNLHKDSWSKRRHHTRWAMAFYYPQDTPIEQGPTGITPGSHYLNHGPGATDEIALDGIAGTVVIVHYDLWHRAMPNLTNRKRFMLKFLFARMEEPKEIQNSNWQVSDPLHRAMWRWHTGGSAQIESNASEISVQDLAQSDEALAIRSAYQLGEKGESSISDLICAMTGPSEGLRQNASYGLAAMGALAVEPLAKLMDHNDESVRVSAIDTLGDLGLESTNVLDQIISVVGDDNPTIRRASIDALGLVSQKSAKAVPALAAALQDKDEWVKRNASLALSRLGPLAKSATSELGKALQDENRYVRANALESLKRIGTEQSETIMFDFLWRARWCSSTTSQSTF